MSRLKQKMARFKTCEQVESQKKTLSTWCCTTCDNLIGS